MKALVVRSRSSEESSKSSYVEKKRSPRLEGPRAPLSVVLLGELESTFLLEGSCGAIKPPEEKNLARTTGTALAIDSSMCLSNAGDATSAIAVGAVIGEFKQIATAGATTAAVTEKVWGEYVSVVCQILAKRVTKMSET